MDSFHSTQKGNYRRVMAELSTAQKLAIITKNHTIVTQLSNKLLEEIAVDYNGALQIPVYSDATDNALAVYTLVAAGLLGEMPTPNSSFRRVFVTMKGYSALLSTLEDVNRDEARESMKGTLPNAFEITQQ